MLPDKELREIRAEAKRALPDVCTIQTRTETNTKGSVAITYADTYTYVPCRLAAVTSVREVERVVGAKLASLITHVLTVAHDQAITARDRVVTGGVTYEVAVMTNANTSWRSARRAFLTRVD